ncbi:uncharacterized protein LOC143828610 isoform X2 [Paroedura picta]|uniref:uncharacterized protein LOC143828610 isoform X2 n=1 Tax=Paroedura picta TaxID=143630 RepID=UPI00405732C8
MAEQAVGKEMLWKECMIKDFLWIGLFCLTATTYFVFRVVKWMISQQKEKGVAPRSGIQGCVEEPSTPGKEAKSTRNRPKRPSQDLSKWMKTLSKDLIKKKTRRGDLIPPSQHPGCTVYWRPPLYVTKKKENAPRCQQKRWGVPQHEMKKAKEYVNQRKNAVCAQKPLLGQELLRRNALKELFQRKEDISAPKIWIAPELEKKWAKEEASRRQKAIDAEIQERERQERLVRPNNQGQKALQEFDFLEESDVLPPSMEGSGQGMGAARDEEEELEQLAPQGSLGGPTAQDAGIPLLAAEEPPGPQEQAGGTSAEGETPDKDPNSTAQLISALESWEQRVMGRLSAMEVRMAGNRQAMRALYREIRALRGQIQSLPEQTVEFQLVHNSLMVLSVNSCNVVFY